MSKSHEITRRALIAGIGTAAACAAFVPPFLNAALGSDACALTLADVEIAALFSEWRAKYFEAARDFDDAKMAEVWAIETRLIPIRPTTAEGFAMKLLIMTAYGEFDLDGNRGESVFADALSLTGLPPPLSAAA